MILDAQSVGDSVDDFFADVESAIGSNVAGQILPLIGQLSGLPDIGQVTAKLEEFRLQIHSVIDDVADPDIAQAIVDAISAANLDGLTAVKTAAGGVQLLVGFDSTVNAGTATANFDALGSFLDLSANIGASLITGLHTTLEFGADGAFSIGDQADPELTVNLLGTLSINDLNASLGVIDVEAMDHDAAEPELKATFGVDLGNGPGGTITVTPTFDAIATLDLDFVGKPLLGLLPKVSGELIASISASDAGIGDPSLSVKNVTLDLKSYLGILGDVTSDIGDLFNTTPFKQIINVALAPVPGLDGIAQKLPFILNLFDKTGDFDGSGDGHITIGDLAIYGNPALEPVIDNFYRVIKIISLLRDIGGISNAGVVLIGDGSVGAGGPVTDTPVADIQAQLKTALGAAGISEDVANFLSDFDISGFSTLAAMADPNDGRLTLNLLEHPEQVLNLLFSDKPVDLVEFNLPAFDFSVTAGGFFPVLGPLGFVLEGNLTAHIDFNIGYDTQGLLDGNPINGFYISTPDNNFGRYPDLSAFDAIGTVQLTLTGGAGIGYAGSRLSVDLSFISGLYAYLDGALSMEGMTSIDGKTRFGDGITCNTFGKIGGTAGVSLDLTIKIDFGLFDVTKHINLARANLGNFDLFHCPPPLVIATPEAPGLATESGSDLLLNVGPRAALRIVVDEADGVAKHVEDPNNPANEGYIISRARDVVDDTLGGTSSATLVANKLDVSAFSLTQRVNIPNLIKADFQGGNDFLVIQDDVTTDSEVHGGAGSDFLQGGAGRDTFYGEDDSDTLNGGDGNDFLYAGKGDDQISGGKGADVIDGGEGIDTVDFSEANRDVMVGVSLFVGPLGFFTGHGGEAEGDSYANVENIVGTDFKDQISGIGASFDVYFDGLAGNDTLTGGNGNDLLIGGVGADKLIGGAGEDGTSYITSWAGVDVDLLRFFQFYGEAAGDRLISIEDIQGSGYDDTIRGDGKANAIDTGDGNDTIEGRGGTDFITAGSGDDRILAIGDGDTIDGGAGIDTLSYENRFFGVTVNLRTAQNADGSFNASAGPDKIVAEVGTRIVGGIELPVILANNSTIENVIGTQASDLITGDIDDNRLSGLGGADFIDGGDGFDRLIGGAGADILFGGAGIDWVEYASSFGGVIVDLELGGFGADAQGDSFSGVENVLGSIYSDTLRGDSENNVINPNVTLLGSTDFVNGRLGIDTLQIDYSAVFVDGSGSGVFGGFNNPGTGTGFFIRNVAGGGAVLDQVDFTNIERLDIVGTRKADVIVGGAYADTIVAQGGDDLVASGKGADFVTAGAGNDFVGYGTGASGGLEANGDTNRPFFLSGGAGIDSLFISLTGAGYDINLAGAAPGVEFHGANLVTAFGGAAVDFEILRDAFTGSGDDRLTQFGRINNNFATGDGNDVITPGLGRDIVDGGLNTAGLSSITQLNDTITVAFVQDYAAVGQSPGDTLVLDYSGLEAGFRVFSGQQLATSLYLAFADGESTTYSALLTNNGAFGTFDSSVFGDSGIPFRATPDDALDLLVYSNIERLDVTGSQGNDIIYGSDAVLDFTVFPSNNELFGSGNRSGDDVLSGLDGNDQIYGGSGNDTIFGGDGDDFLQGTDIFDNPNNPGNGGGTRFIRDTAVANFFNGYYDDQEVDTLTGGAGGDTFVLGNGQGVFYNGFGSTRYYFKDELVIDPSHAVITDFNHDEGDVIQLWSRAENYITTNVEGGSLIFYRTYNYYGDYNDSYSEGYNDGNNEGNSENIYSNNLIAEVRGVYDLDLNSDSFTYVSDFSDAFAARSIAAPDAIDAVAAPDSATGGILPDLSVIRPLSPEASSFSTVPVEPASPAIAKLANFAPLLADETFTVTQESTPAALKAALDGGAGVVSSSITLSGSAEAFGTFANDPFGLGSGIILSTGRVEDLPGENTASSGGSNVNSVSVNFEFIGRSGNNDIFRANLSDLGIDLKSITLNDSGSITGGSGGIASGFDLGAIVLSKQFIGSAIDLDLDDPANLSRLNVFDFSSATITYHPGTQRPPSGGFDYGEDLINAQNNLTNAGIIGFDKFLALPGEFGSISLGDGGSIGFDLNSVLSTTGPLYLYIAEEGGSGEIVTGAINASSDTVVPTGDLSTDLGAVGAGGDDTVLTYSFTPKAGDNAFSLDAVLFSEELPEFDGVDLSDFFSIKLNGVEIGSLSNNTSLSIKSLVYGGSGDLINNPVGTGPLADVIKADAYTRILTITGQLNPGTENVLTIEVKDGRDAYLDSGLLIRDGSFKTFVAPTLTILPEGGTPGGDDGFDGSAQPGDCVNFTISLPPGILLTAPVDVLLTPTGNLDLGGGAGKSITVHFGLGGPTSLTFCATVVPGSDPNEDGSVDIDVTSDDPAINVTPIAPVTIDVLPVDDHDPFLIFDARAGDIIPGFTTGNETVDGSGRPGPTSFYVAGDITGKDIIRGFGRPDILVIDHKLFDSNNDGLIDFGRNKLLDLDLPGKSTDTIQFVDPAVKGLRYLGTDGIGNYVYGTAGVAPKGSQESILGDDNLFGDFQNVKRDVFFFDTNLDINLGHDKISRFGSNDVIVTTSRIFDDDNDGVILLDQNDRLDLNGNSFLDATHGGDQFDASPFGQIEINDIGGQSVDAVYYQGSTVKNGVSYFFYGLDETRIVAGIV